MAVVSPGIVFSPASSVNRDFHVIRYWRTLPGAGTQVAKKLVSVTSLVCRSLGEPSSVEEWNATEWETQAEEFHWFSFYSPLITNDWTEVIVSKQTYKNELQLRDGIAHMWLIPAAVWGSKPDRTKPEKPRLKSPAITHQSLLGPLRICLTSRIFSPHAQGPLEKSL